MVREASGLKSPCSAGDVDSITGQSPLCCRATDPCSATRESMLHNERSHIKQWRSCMLQLRPNAAK